VWLTPHPRDFQPEGERERERDSLKLQISVNFKNLLHMECDLMSCMVPSLCVISGMLNAHGQNFWQAAKIYSVNEIIQ